MIVAYVVSFCVGLVVSMVLTAAAVMSGVSYESALAGFGETTAMSYLFALVVSVAYETLAEGLHGSTLGKMALGLTVLGEDGRFCRIGPAFGRSLAFFIDGLFFGLPALVSMNGTSRRQRLGDKWAKTVVVRRKSAKADQLRPVGRFIGVTCLAILVYAFFIGVSLFF